MSTDDVALLTEYDEWKATKRVQRDDLSPEAFLIDRAKDQALQKLIKISDTLEEFYSLDDEDDDEKLADQMAHLIGKIALVIEQ
jgi:hypothetical protein